MLGRTAITLSIFASLLAIPLAQLLPNLGIYIVILPVILYGIASHAKLNSSDEKEIRYISRMSGLFYILYATVWLIYAFVVVPR